MKYRRRWATSHQITEITKKLVVATI